MLCHDLTKHGLEFARAIRNRHYEVSPGGIHFPKQRAIVAGQFDTWINGRDHQVDPNKVPTEALNYMLTAAFKATGALSGWYISPFLNNVVPGATLTGATYTATLGEFIAYDEAARVAWTLPASTTVGSFDNSAAPAVFTASASVGNTVGVNIYGAAILSASAKSATTGPMAAASLFSAARNLHATDKLTVQYTIAATSTT